MCGGVLLLLIILLVVLIVALTSSKENFREHEWCATYFDECFRQCVDEANGLSDRECAKKCNRGLKICHNEGRFPRFTAQDKPDVTF